MDIMANCMLLFNPLSAQAMVFDILVSERKRMTNSGLLNLFSIMSVLLV